MKHLETKVRGLDISVNACGEKQLNPNNQLHILAFLNLSHLDKKSVCPDCLATIHKS